MPAGQGVERGPGLRNVSERCFISLHLAIGFTNKTTSATLVLMLESVPVSEMQKLKKDLSSVCS